MPGTRLYTQLVGTTALTDLVGTRVYPSVLPQGVTLPAVTFQRVGTTPTNGSTGGGDVSWARFQLTGYAVTYLAARGVADAVRGALRGWQSSTGTPNIDMVTYQGEYDLPEPPESGQDNYIHGVAQDWYVQFAST